MKFLLIIVITCFQICLFAWIPAWSAGRPVVIQSRGMGGLTGKFLYKESYALLVGASNYYSWPKLPGVRQDIDSLEKVLVQHGFKVTKVMDPDSVTLRTVFDTFALDHGLAQDTRLLFYFAGHGYTRKLYGGDIGYIVPIDAARPDKAREFRRKALPISFIENLAARLDVKHALFIFDSCFSGSIFALSRSIPPASITYKTSRPVRQFITSGSADEEVPDKSIFLKELVSALKGEGDVNNDGYVTGSELGYFLSDKVVNYSRNSQHPQYGKIRNPRLDKGDYVFVLPEKRKNSGSIPGVSPSDERLFWESVSTTKNPEELKAFLENFPNGVFSKLARIRLKGLLADPKEAVTADSQVRELLQKISAKIDSSSLTAPANDNALFYIRKVLKLDPANTKAKKMLTRVGKKLLADAQISLDRGDIAAAESTAALMTDLGNEFSLKFGDLSLLNRKITKQRKKERAELLRKEKITSLLSEVSRCLGKNQLVVPENKNALYYIGEVWKLDAGNAEAEKYLDTIKAKLLQQVKESLEQGNIADAEKTTKYLAGIGHDFGLKIDALPDLHKKIATVRDRNKKKQQRNRQLTSLLAKAEQQIAQKQYLTPNKNNALETLRRAWKIDPENSRVKKMFTKLGNNMLAEAQTLLDRGNLGKAETMVASVSGLAGNFALEFKKISSLRDTIDARQVKEKQIREQQKKIVALLSGASSSLAKHHLLSPEKDNALFFLKEVRRLDPANKKARKMAIELVRALLKQGEKDLAHGKVKIAEQIYAKCGDTALLFGLPLAGITDFGRAIKKQQQEIAEAVKQQQIKEQAEQQPVAAVAPEKEKKQENSVAAGTQQLDILISRAKKQVKKLQLTSPAGDNAMETLRAIEQASPGHPAVGEIATLIARRYMALSEKWVTRANWGKADQRCRQARQIAREFHLTSIQVTSLKKKIRDARAGYARYEQLLDSVSSSLQKGEFGKADDVLKKAEKLARRYSFTGKRLHALSTDLTEKKKQYATYQEYLKKGAAALESKDIATGNEFLNKAVNLARANTLPLEPARAFQQQIEKAEKKKSKRRIPFFGGTF